MDTQQVLMMIVVYNSFFVLLAGIMFIARKEIFFRFVRLFSKKGCYVFVANSNRNITKHFKTPKNNMFKIDKKTYITNPDKVESLDERMYKEVFIGIEKKKKNFEKRIEFFNNKIKEIKAEQSKLDKKNAAKEIGQFDLQIKEFENKIKIIQKKMEEREQVHYYDKKPAFFYIEGDPVPKDFYEWYTHLDSEMIDNILARSLTKDPKAVNDLERWLKMMKIWIFVILGIVALIALIVFKNQSMITQMAQQAGITLKV